jgi:hypothetical protein
MTLVSSIIQKAFRATNLIPVGQSPTTNQISEALDLFNNIVLSSIGNEVGDGLRDINIGGTCDESRQVQHHIPDGARLVLNLTAGQTLKLDPHPYEGQRLAIVDVGGNLGTYNLILSGNGRNIEGATTVTLSTNGDSRHWLYRADTGNWVKVTTLLSSDTVPLPQEFDDYFITMLAMRLNPQFAQTTTPETSEILKRARTQLRDRYHNYKQIRSSLPHFRWFNTYRYADNFDRGYDEYPFCYY